MGAKSRDKIYRVSLALVICILTYSFANRPVAPVFAQAPGGTEMCGDGTTFTINLPGLPGVLPGGLPAPDDSVTLPNGCRIYALLVSGYGINPQLDQFTFYNLAKFVAENNGYVHYAWWNNLTGEYLSRPLHGSAHPGSLMDPHLLGFVPKNFPEVTTVVPKGVPEEDFQFQADAKLFLNAIRANNPNAIIIVAGHSMGGNAVARLGANPNVSIDLLAPIDPVGNRSRPVGQLLPPTQTFNWTRWRVANNLLGYRQRDCVRNALGLCRDFDPRPFRVSFRCTVGPLLADPPVLGSRAPLVCPRLLPIVVTGPRPTIGANVRFLYHRWQKEFTFPFDFGADERLTRGPLTGILGGNYQVPVLKNSVGESDRNKTCGLAGNLNLGLLAIQALGSTFILPAVVVQPGAPRDPNISCNPLDGHGEIVGVYTPGGTITPYAVEAQDDWPCSTEVIPLGGLTTNCDPDPNKDEQDRQMLRRQKLIEMTTAPSPDPNKTINGPHNWAHEPLNPNLDMVVDDMIIIVQHLLSQQPGPGGDVAPPVTAAAANPAANANDWNNTDVTVTLNALDEPGGSGVKEIVYVLSGAQPGGDTVSGDIAQFTVSAEGTTGVTFFARDNDGNEGSPTVLSINIDKTPPTISASVTPPPNANGWHNGDVTVSFDADDPLSGLDTVTDPILVTTEGEGQEIIGTATDRAGNTAAAGATLNIDKTPPMVVGTADRPPDSNGWYNHALTVTWSGADSLSGVATCSGPSSYDGPDSADASVAGSCNDLAGNVGNGSFGFQFDKTPPLIAGLPTPDSCTLWPPNHKLVHVATVTASDSPSGLAPGSFLLGGLSNEPGDGLGDGDIAPDVVIGNGTVQLRAERSGTGDGRVYTLTVNASDLAGNSIVATAHCTVPHDQGKGKFK